MKHAYCLRCCAIVLITCMASAASASESITLKTLTPQLHFTLSDGREGALAGVVPLGRDAPLTLPPRWMDAPVRLEEASIDRYGKPHYWVYQQSGNALLQADLAASGLVMPYSHDGALPAALAALPITHEAMISADDAARVIGQWAQVRGIIRHVSVQKTAAYLNFAEDWKSDFTIHLPKIMLKHYGAETLEALKGKEVRVRGFVHRYAGARITLLEPSMLEVVANEPN